MKEMIGGCCVCSDEQGWAENPLVYCDGKNCNVAVHQACYGIESVPLGPWFCRKCEFRGDRSSVICKLCPNEDGALKRTDTNEWAHVICALYIPEVEFGNVKSMEPIVISKLPANRFAKTCYICEIKSDSSTGPKNAGACMACQKAECPNAFHVTCGQKAGLLCEKRSKTKDNIKYTGFCSFHYKKEFRPSQFLAVPAYVPPPVKEIDAKECDGKSNVTAFDKHKWESAFLSTPTNKDPITTLSSIVRDSQTQVHSVTKVLPIKSLSDPFQTPAPSLFDGGSDGVGSSGQVKEESSWSLSKFMSLHQTPNLASTSCSGAILNSTISGSSTLTTSLSPSGTEKKKITSVGLPNLNSVSVKREANAMDREEHEKKSKLVRRKGTTDSGSGKQIRPHPHSVQQSSHKKKDNNLASSLPKPLFSDDEDSFGSIKNIEEAIRETDSTIAKDTLIEGERVKKKVKTEPLDVADEFRLEGLKAFSKISGAKTITPRASDKQTPAGLNNPGPVLPLKQKSKLEGGSANAKRSFKKKEPNDAGNLKSTKASHLLGTPGMPQHQSFPKDHNPSGRDREISSPSKTNLAPYSTPTALKVEAGTCEENQFIPDSEEQNPIAPPEDLIAQFDFQKLQQDVFAENFKTLLQTLPPEMISTLVAYDEQKVENQRLQNYIKTLQMEYSILKSLHSSLL